MDKIKPDWEKGTLWGTWALRLGPSAGLVLYVVQIDDMSYKVSFAGKTSPFRMSSLPEAMDHGKEFARNLLSNALEAL